jgi:hypothetical protein
MAGFTLNDQQWPFIIGSDVQRDGLYLEVQNPQGDVAFEIFRSDRERTVTFTAFQEDIPMEVVEAAAAFARPRLWTFVD